MSFEEINLYVETMQEKEENDLKLDLNMRFYQAVMTSAEKPHKVYKEIWSGMFNKNKKSMTDEQMKNVGRAIALMYGEVKKGGG